MKVLASELIVKCRTVNPICNCFFYSRQILVALTFVQMVSRMSCSPTTYVISSYSNVRLQQPSNGLSVESQTPMDIMLNPILADEPPTTVDKMESIFMKSSEQIRNLKTVNVDEKHIMESINKANATDTTDDERNENIFDETDFITLGTETPSEFSIMSDTTVPTTD